MYKPFGFKSSSGYTKIPKYSPVFKSWCRGNTKPTLYRRWWILQLEVAYIDTLEEIDNPRHYVLNFDYEGEHVRDYVRKARDMAVENLMMDGLTVISTSIKLVANR